jgi:hypothetical protein
MFVTDKHFSLVWHTVGNHSLSPGDSSGIQTLDLRITSRVFYHFAAATGQVVLVLKYGEQNRLRVTNALAYFGTALVTKKKSFIIDVTLGLIDVVSNVGLPIQI